MPKESITLYYSSDIDAPWSDLQKILKYLKTLNEAGISINMIDTAEMSDKECFDHYMASAYPSVRKQYRIRQLFGTRWRKGHFFGRQQPALVVYEDDSRHPVDIYPHDINSKRVSICDYLEQKLPTLALIPEGSKAKILELFTCSIEHIEENKAYLRLRNQDEDEDSDLCLEYPLEELKQQVGSIAEGMFLHCEIREVGEEKVTFYFEPAPPKILSQERRQALLDKYSRMFTKDE